MTLEQATPLAAAARPTIVAVAVVYFVVVAAISVWATRRTRTAHDFFVAGEGIGLVVLAIASMAATLSGFAMIGGPGLVHAVGVGGMFLVLPAGITGTLTAWVLAKRIRLLGELRGLMTVPDAIGVRYGSPLAQGLAGTAILIAVIGYLATNLLALGLVIDAIFGWGFGWSVWLGTAVVLGYTAAGGILAGVYTDLFQGAVMAAASALVFALTLEVGGGLAGISRTILPAAPEFLGPFGTLTPLAALSLFFVFGLGSLGQPQVIHKFYMLKDPRRLKWYPLLTTTAILVTLLLYFGVGMVTKALVVRGELAPLATADDATPVFLLRYAPAFIAAVVFSGVAAAIMSTVNSFLNIGAAVITHDLPVAFGRRMANELAWGRAATVLIALAAGLVAQHAGVLVAFLGIFGWGLFASTLVAPLAIGLNWAGATRAGAIASIVAGLVSTLVLESLAYFRVWTFPAGVSAAGVALVASLLVFFAVSWATRAGAAAQLAPDVRLVLER
jgi:Na+/proline symporter